MKVAVAYKDGKVFQHFGHSEEFKIYVIKDDKVIASKVLPVKGSGHETTAVFLNSYMVEALICGGIGGDAIKALERFDIAVFGGVEGDADQAVKDLLADRLERTVAPNCSHSCSEHGCSSCHA